MREDMPLGACPCGKVPEQIHIFDANQGGKYAHATPSCCGEWMIEFRSGYNEIYSPECKRLAIAAWNDAPRGSNLPTRKEIEG